MDSKIRATMGDTFFQTGFSILLYSTVLLILHFFSSNSQANPVNVNGSLSLPGTWSHCNKFGKTSTEFKWTFSGMTFVNIKGDYMNNDCSGAPAHGYSELYSGSYVIGSQHGKSSEMNTTKLNLTVEKAFGMPMAPYKIYTIYAIDKNILYLGDTRTGPDGFSPGARPSKLQIDDGDYIRLD